MPTTQSGADGARIDVDLPLAQIGRTLERNVNIDSLVYFTSPAVFRDILTLQDKDDRQLISPDLSSAFPRRLFGFPVFLSSQISTSEVQGGSGAASTFSTASSCPNQSDPAGGPSPYGLPASCCTGAHFATSVHDWRCRAEM